MSRGHKKQNGKMIILALVLCVAFLLLLPFSFAAVLTGNITLGDVDVNPAAAGFNFTSNSTGSSGHFIANVSAGQGLMVVLKNQGSIRFRNMGSRTYQDYFNTNAVIMHNFTDDFGQGYTSNSEDVWAWSFPPLMGDAVQFIVSNGSGGWYHGLLWIANITSGNNVTILFKLNNQTNNNTFATVGGCEAHATPTSCTSDFANNCDWMSTGALCKERQAGFRHDIPPAECDMLPEVACKSLNTTACSWNPSIGTRGKCERGPEYNPEKGFNCSQINQSAFCNNQGFTEKTGLCTWDYASTPQVCNLNRSKTFNDITERPPVFFCEATGYVNNQTKCQNLSDHYYMPCGWNTDTGKCGPLFFDFGKFDKFDDIGSESNCQTVGGTWRSEATYDPVNNLITTESWCEFGTSVKTFGTIGGGGFSSGGQFGNLNDCSVDCFGCEFLPNGSRWASSAEAQGACQGSAKGCKFRSDTNAFNGFGWCEPAYGFGNFNCDNSCGDCMLLPNASNACQNSPAGCKWDNVTNFCLGNTMKGCSQSCLQCGNEASCLSSTASPPNNCGWDDEGFFCHPEDGKYEVCFNGVDDDNNDKTDCQDSKCSTDVFCAGSVGQGGGCFQYDPFSFLTMDNAKNNCTNGPDAADCYWQQETPQFGFCAPKSEQCFENETIQSNEALCNSFNDGDTCNFVAETRCSENISMVNACELFTDNTTCMRANSTGCLWRQDLGNGLGECDTKAFFSCEMNQALQGNQNACMAAGCAWIGNQFGGGFEGGFFNSCVTPCFNSSITTQNACEAANGSNFVKGTCVWQTGFCEPNDFIGGCFENDGDISECQENSNCNWFENRFGPLRDLNGSSDYNKKLQPQATWIAIGLQFPFGAGRNMSIYNLSLRDQTGWVWLYSANENTTSVLGNNVTRLYCNNGIVMEYNWTSNVCTTGSCDRYNGTARCGDYTLHYYLKNSSKELEALWQVPVEAFNLDALEGDNITTDTLNKTTILIDGNLSEHVRENATARDGSNATRIKTSAGFCNDGLVNSFFQGMDEEPPLIIAVDSQGDLSSTTPSDHSYLDIQGIGVKKTPEAYAYGIRVEDIRGSALCNAVSIGGQSPGTGSNKSRYYLYLDTDGKSTGGCASDDNSAIVGFEYQFKYVAEISGDTGRLSETLLSQKCASGSWAATNIPFKSDKNKGCDFVNGPIFAIDKDTLTGKSDVNTSRGWRVYASSAHSAGNSSNVSDAVGPGSADFAGIDTEIIDCTSTSDKDNSQCTKFKQFGFFPGEFGPACLDNIDNDGDSLTDCSDFDCAYDPFFCGSGTFTGFAVNANDKEAPSIVWNKVNDRIPTALTFIYDTNEPSNGSLKFYSNDSKCSSLNSTAYDKALLDSDAFTNFRPHHISEVTGLTLNTTYFYKLQVCDPSGNCGTSKCSNATTSKTHTNITFRLAIPQNWSVDIPSMNLTNYSLSYALKASTEFLDSMNITVKSPDNTSAITFIGVDIFEKQTLNVSEFITGSGLVGFDANQYQSFKQKTGIDKTLIKIPTAGSIISHCDEDGSNCKVVTDNVACTTGSAYTECQVPDAVGLGFSTYKATSPSSSPSPNSGGGGGGGGAGASGGGGAAVVTSGTSKSQVWDEIAAGQDTYLTVQKDGIPLVMVVFSLTLPASSAEMKVSVLDTVPVEASPHSLYKYVSITTKNLPTETISSPEIEFSVEKSWLSQNSVDEKNVALYRFSANAWNELATSLVSSDDANAYYRAQTPGFSYFAIAGVPTPAVPEGLGDVVAIEDVPIQGAVVEEPQMPQEEEEEESQGPLTILVILGSIAVIVLLIIHFRKRN